MISKVSLAAACLLASAVAVPVQAKEWKFDLVNKSAASVLSFKTLDGRRWSKNWLEENVAPGETFVMDFGTDEGDCTVKTRIEFSDDTHVEADIDYCSASTITVRNSGIVWR